MQALLLSGRKRGRHLSQHAIAGAVREAYVQMGLCGARPVTAPRAVGETER